MTGAGAFASVAVITIATIRAGVMQHQCPPPALNRAVTYSVWRVLCDRRRAVNLVDGHLPLPTNAPGHSSLTTGQQPASRTSAP